MEIREQLIRELSEKGIYQARKMSVSDMQKLLREMERSEKLMKGLKLSVDDR